jgi:hypothetical protein
MSIVSTRNLTRRYKQGETEIKAVDDAIPQVFRRFPGTILE